MTSPRDEKIKIGNTILAVLEKNKTQSRQALVASLELETGFTARVIQNILVNLISVGKIKCMGDELSAVEKEA